MVLTTKHKIILYCSNTFYYFKYYVNNINTINLNKL